MKFVWEDERYSLWAGKFNPAFGLAWDQAPGIWGADFAEDYEIAEKIGGGASYTFSPAGLGTHTVTANTFFTDTSVLSQAAITSRGQTRIISGGAGNTEDFSSYTLSLDSENLAGVENLGYHMGFRYQAEQDANRDATTDNEKGFALALKYMAPINDQLSLDFIGEYAALERFEGVRNSDRDYTTFGAAATIMENWNLAASYTFRDIDNDGTGAANEDHLFQLSGGYDFGNGFTFDIGWKSFEEANVDTSLLGALLAYEKSF